MLATKLCCASFRTCSAPFTALVSSYAERGCEAPLAAALLPLVFMKGCPGVQGHQDKLFCVNAVFCVAYEFGAHKTWADTNSLDDWLLPENQMRTRLLSAVVLASSFTLYEGAGELAL